MMMNDDIVWNQFKSKPREEIEQFDSYQNVMIATIY